jgi:hypothetical protein
MKAQQIEYLIQSLPIPEPEEVQVRTHPLPACMGISHTWRMLMPSLPPLFSLGSYDPQKAARLATLEEDMQRANQDYAAAVARASTHITHTTT